MNTPKTIPNLKLREERLHHQWSQQEVAERIGVTVVTVNRWERGVTAPSPHYRFKLCKLFGKSAEALGFFKEDVTGSSELSETPGLYDPALPFPLHGTSRLVGREAVVEQVVQQLCSRAGSLALTGLPGVGKTALAIAIGQHPTIRQHFREGVFWAGLGPRPRLLDTLSRWGTLFDLTIDETDTLTDIDAWARYLHEKIGLRRMLFIIDDAWELVEALTLRLGGSNCSYLLTTRFPTVALPFAREQVIHLQELTEEQSLELLQQLAPVVSKDVAETGMYELATSVGGLPLALTLIGRYLHVQAQSGQPRRLRSSIQRLTQSVKERLSLAEPHVPWEHASSLPVGDPLSLQSAIEISERHLSTEAKAALRSLSVFPAKPYSFSEEAAIAVCAVDVEVLDTLMDSGLLESNQPGRYYLHQTIADYARMHGTDTSVEERLVAFFVDFVEQHRHDDEALDLELHNIVAALEVAFAHRLFEPYIQGVLTFLPFLEKRRLYTLAESLLMRTREAAEELHDERNLAQAYMAMGRIAEQRSDIQQAEQAYLQALKIARCMNDIPLVAHLLVLSGGVIVDQGDFSRAEACMLEGLALLEQLNDQQMLSVVLKHLGEVADNRGDNRRASEFYQRGLECARKSENREMVSAILQDMGALAVQGGEYAQALAYYQEGLQHARQIGNLRRQSAILMNMGMLAFHQQQYARAITLSLESLRLARSIGNRLRISSVLQNLGMLEGVRGNYIQAEIYLQESLKLAQEIGHSWLICETRYEQAALYLRQQRLQDAERTFQLVLQEARTLEARVLMAHALFGLAQVAAQQGDISEAIAHGQESLPLFEYLEHEQAPRVALWVESMITKVLEKKPDA